MNSENRIGAANYLQKGNGDYIPFRIFITRTTCDKINLMLS